METSFPHLDISVHLIQNSRWCWPLSPNSHDDTDIVFRIHDGIPHEGTSEQGLGGGPVLSMPKKDKKACGFANTQ